MIARSFVSTTALSLSLFLLIGCPAREVARVEPDQNKEQEKRVPVQLNRDIDILFVIDNSGSMRDEQDSLAENFDRFINVLNNIEGGLPNVHLGVVSSDLGAGPFGIDACNANGDNGSLQTGDGCASLINDGKAFIEDIARDDGTRVTNYGGTLAEAFSCNARLGTTGCGFEQHLEAMYRALDNNPANTGFIREDAFLAVIFLADEDDCSVSDTEMFNTSQDSLDSSLGPLSSFRCFEFGIRCDPDSPREPGPRMNCESRDDSMYMHSVDRYIEFLRNYKDDPGQVIVAGIYGNPSPVNVSIETDPMDNNQEAVLQPSCVSGAGEADPAIRLQRFIEAFPQRSTSTTICNEDLSDALTLIAELLATAIGNPCLEGNLDANPDMDGVQADCTVSDVRFQGLDNEEEKVIPPCDIDPTLPCWRLIEDQENCGSTATQLALEVCRGIEEDDSSCPDGAGTTVPSSTTTVVRCVSQ